MSSVVIARIELKEQRVAKLEWDKHEGYVAGITTPDGGDPDIVRYEDRECFATIPDALRGLANLIEGKSDVG